MYVDQFDSNLDLGFVGVLINSFVVEAKLEIASALALFFAMSRSAKQSQKLLTHGC